MSHLSDVTLQKLPYGSQYTVWDAIPCFGIRVGRKTKTFVVKQNNRYYVIGRYPIISLKVAREEAKRRLALKYFPKSSINTLEASKQYLDAIKGEKRPNTLYVYQLYLQRLPRGSLHQLTAQQLYNALPNTRSAANLCFSAFKAFLSWCVERGHLTANPLIGRRQPNKVKSRDRLLTDDEIRLIWQESYNHNSFGAIVRLLVLSGQRLTPISAAKKEWIDYTANTIVFPAYIMKGNTEHQIPLLPYIQRELTSLPFPKQSISAAMKRFREALPHIPHYTLHDARRYFSSTMARLKVPQEVTEKLLAHKTGKMTPIAAVYNRHQYLEEQREALEKYHSHLRDLLNLPEPT